MSGNDSINRRQFLEKSSLLAAAATAVGGARTASAQINNSAAISTKPVRLGFIGVGIRGTLLMEAAAGIAGVEIKAAADCYKGHLDRAQELITPAPSVTGDYKEILSRADVDAVAIATPDHWHLRMTQEALAAGKHVYIEKPMTHRWEDGEAFIAAADKSGKVVQVGSQYVSMGCAQKAADLIKSGQLGQVTLVEGKIHRNTPTGAWYYPIPPDASPATVDWKALPRLRPAARLRPPALLPVAALLGLLGRPADRPLRAPHHRHAPAHGRAGARERLQLRRHLPLEELPRGAGPDGVDGEVPGGLRPAPLEHRDQRPSRAAPHVLRHRGHARVQRRLVQVLLRAALRELRLLDAFLAQGHAWTSSGS